MFACIINGANPSKGYSENELKGKHIHQILEMLSLPQSSYHINYTCPLYQVRLDNKDIPLKKYPDILAKGKPDPYPPPESYLRIIEHTNPEDLFQQADVIFNFNVKTQIETTFSPLPVPFKESEIKSMKISDVIERCKVIFEYGLEPDTPVTLSVNDKIINEKDSFKSYAKDCYKKPLTFSCTVNAKAKKKIEFRIISATEITQNELKYIKQISYLLEFWKPAFEKEKLFEENDMRMLFRDIPLILNAHCFFSKSLETGPISFASEFGAKFLLLLQFFKIAATYVAQFEQIDKMLTEKCKNRVFSAKLSEIEERIQEKIQLNFISNYIIPVQHYPRYKTLLMELNKLTPSFHPDKQYVLKAIELTETVVQQFDNSTNRMKQLEAINDLQNAIGKTIVLSKPGRNLISHTSIRFSRPKDLTGDIFMFNDLVVITTTKRQKLTPLLSIPLNQFRFVNGKPSADAIFFFVNDKDYAIHFKDPEEKQNILIPVYMSWGNFFDVISLKSYYVKWVDINTTPQLPLLMDLDGCTIQNCALFFGGVNQLLAETNQLIQFKLINGQPNESPKSPPIISPKTIQYRRRGSHSSISVSQDGSNNNSFFCNGEWSVQDTPVPKREYHSVVSVGDKMYVFFGCTRKIAYNDVWVFDFLSNQWEEIKPKEQNIEGRSGHSSIVWNDKIVIFGGKTQSGRYLNSVLIFDTKINDFVPNVKVTGDLPTACNLHSASYIPWNETMIVIGGRSDKGLLNDIKILDLKTMTWTAKSNFNISPKVSHHSLSIENGRFVVIVGGLKEQEDSEIIVIDTQQWTSDCAEQYGNIPFGISHFAVTSINNENVQFITFGGIDDFSKLPNCASSYLIDTTGGIREVCQLHVALHKPKVPETNEVTQKETKSPEDNEITPEEIQQEHNENNEATLTNEEENLQQEELPQNEDDQTKEETSQTEETPPQEEDPQKEETSQNENDENTAIENNNSSQINDTAENDVENGQPVDIFENQPKKVLPIPLPTSSQNRRRTFEKNLLARMISLPIIKARRSSEATPSNPSMLPKKLPVRPNSGNESENSESENDKDVLGKPKNLGALRSQEDLKYGALKQTVSEQEFAAQLGIDLSGLTPITQHIITIKLQKLMNLKKANEEIEKNIVKYESRSENPNTSSQLEYTAKLFLNDGKMVKVFKADSNLTQADILNIISTLINKDGCTVSVLTEPSITKELTNESLQEAYQSINSSKLRTLNITVT